MMRVARGLIIILLLSLLWPEIARYRSEHRLIEASRRIERVLGGIDQGAVGTESVDRALVLAHTAALDLPGDPRPQIQEGVALILRGRGIEAIALFDAAVAIGERPELTVNLGRARSSAGDEVGARAAFLRTAWASPNGIATLPKTLRVELLDEVANMEVELRTGRLEALPPF
jgi:hypothetical protein